MSRVIQLIADGGAKLYGALAGFQIDWQPLARELKSFCELSHSLSMQQIEDELVLIGAALRTLFRLATDRADFYVLAARIVEDRARSDSSPGTLGRSKGSCEPLLKATTLSAHGLCVEADPEPHLLPSPAFL